MKKMKRFAAIAAATVMAVSMASITAFAEGSYTITIDNNASGHTYEAYQIFSGDITTDDATGKLVLSNAVWGTGVSSESGDATSAVESLSNGTTTLVDFIGGLTLSDVKVTSTWDGSASNYTISGLSAGYYLVKDSDAGNPLEGENDAYSYTIVKVVGADTTITPKSDKPTVDKQVYDNDDGSTTGDNNGWGETADHAINESFQFKLTANIPDNDNIDKYQAYKLEFTDTLGTGVVFDSIASVTVNGTETTAYTLSANAVAGLTNDTWTLTITDLKNIVSDIGGAEVIVTYNAHLDENAAMAGSATDNNQNKVSLKYTNNPSWDGTGTSPTGETPEDTVFVYTYKVDNTKYAEAADPGKELAGAEFRLYESDGTTEIDLIYDSAKSAYRPIKAGETATVMTSAASTGIFNIIGLDAGTYVLKETKAPEGYNLADPITIVIKAAHEETTNDVPSLDMTGSQNNVNSIIDNKGSTLPETGGMGTKIFTVAGGTIVLGAGVLLITKKRMKKED